MDLDELTQECIFLFAVEVRRKKLFLLWYVCFMRSKGERIEMERIQVIVGSQGKCKRRSNGGSRVALVASLHGQFP